MMRRALLALLLACASPGALPAADSGAMAAGTTQFRPAQLRDFPRDTLTIARSSGRDSFHVWLAISPAQQQQGLMWIRRLPADHGMLFLLDEPRPMNMWMKNTFVSLDMLFFDAGGRITHVTHRATPQSEAIIDSGGNVAGVLEIAGGEASRRGIVVGDRIEHRALKSRQ